MKRYVPIVFAPLAVALSSPVVAQDTAPPADSAAHDVTELPETPSAPVLYPGMTGPLGFNPNPTKLNAGPLGDVYVTGVVSGLAQWQDSVFPGDHKTQADLSNGQVFVQKTDGPLQFFVQAGVYSLPDLGLPYLKATTATKTFFGAVPQAFVKLAPTGNFSIAVDDRAATPFGVDQAGAAEDGQMGGHGILRHVELAGDFARGEAIGFVAHQQPEHIEARALRQRPQGRNSRLVIHISSIADISDLASREPSTTATSTATRGAWPGPTASSSRLDEPFCERALQNLVLCYSR